ncbi:MAG: hypothetical protein FWE50_01060 [Alphaproteobacteria bacterium]|nr:hypothetical protein [Alphaproteobacteria bacterium]
MARATNQKRKALERIRRQEKKGTLKNNKGNNQTQPYSRISGNNSQQNLSYEDFKLLRDQPEKFFAKHWGDFSEKFYTNSSLYAVSEGFSRYIQSIANTSYSVTRLNQFVAEKLGRRR